MSLAGLLHDENNGHPHHQDVTVRTKNGEPLCQEDLVVSSSPEKITL